jgi:hypothetical protein
VNREYSISAGQHFSSSAGQPESAVCRTFGAQSSANRLNPDRAMVRLIADKLTS